MNPHRFDALARALASGTSRRRVLKGIVGLATGGVLASPLIVRAVGDTPCTTDQDCRSDQTCVDSACRSTSPTPTASSSAPATSDVSSQSSGSAESAECIRGQACVGDDPCCPGESCCGGVCLEGDSCAEAALTQCILGQSCLGDDPCCPGESCCGGFCVPGDNCEEAAIGCTADTDCASDLVCISGACQQAESAGTGSAAGCTSDGDCNAGDVCLNGACQTPAPAPQAECVTVTRCSGDGDCVSGQSCVNGICQQRISPPVGGCQGNDDCGAGETCVGGQCQQTTTPAPESTVPAQGGGTVPPSDGTAPATGDLSRIAEVNPAHFHTGACGSQDPTPAYRLFDLRTKAPAGTPTPNGGPVGAANGVSVRQSVTLLDVQLSDLLNSPFVLDVHASAEDLGTVIACGDVGGQLAGKDLAIGLREVSNSGFSGIAWLRDEGERTLVYVFLAQGLCVA